VQKPGGGASGGVKNAIIVVSAARCLAAKGGSRYGRQTKSGWIFLSQRSAVI